MCNCVPRCSIVDFAGMPLRFLICSDSLFLGQVPKVTYLLCGNSIFYFLLDNILFVNLGDIHRRKGT